jgi:hypothetical protein
MLQLELQPRSHQIQHLSALNARRRQLGFASVIADCAFLDARPTIVKLDLAPDALEMRIVRYANDKELQYAVNVNRSASLALFSRARDMAAAPGEG